MSYYNYAEMKDGKIIKRKKIKSIPIEKYGDSYEIKLAELKVLDDKEYKSGEELSFTYQITEDEVIFI